MRKQPLPFALRLLAAVSVLLLALPAPAADYVPPRHDWQRRAPAEMGFDADALAAAVAYAIFFATFLYLIAFVGDLPFAPRTIDRGPEAPVAVEFDEVLKYQPDVVERVGSARVTRQAGAIPRAR